MKTRDTLNASPSNTAIWSSRAPRSRHQSPPREERVLLARRRKALLDRESRWQVQDFLAEAWESSGAGVGAGAQAAEPA